MASICSLANWISSASKAALAGRTRPTVSPGVRRLGLMVCRDGVAAFIRGDVAAAAAAVRESLAKSRRLSMGGDCHAKARRREENCHAEARASCPYALT